MPSPARLVHEMRHGRNGESEVKCPSAATTEASTRRPFSCCCSASTSERTEDLATVRSLWPNVEAALEWIDTIRGPGRRWVRGISSTDQGGPGESRMEGFAGCDFPCDGRMAEGPIALCEVQAYVYGAKRHAACWRKRWATRIGRRELASQAESLRRNFEAKFWCEELSVYALALDGAKQPCRVISSNAGQVLFTGIASAERAERVAHTLLSSKVFSGWGIRTWPHRRRATTRCRTTTGRSGRTTMA